MPIGIQVFVTGIDEQDKRLQELSKELFLFKDALEQIGENTTSFFAGEVFASQGGAIDERWEPLSKEYALYKATGHTTSNPESRRPTSNVNTYPGRGILVREGDMQNSFFYEADESSLIVSNSSDHFVYHQSDEPRNSGLPSRVLIKATDPVKTMIADIINADVAKKLSKFN